MDTSLILRWITHLVVGLSIGWLCLTGYRSVRRRSEVLGLILGVGLVARVTVGLTLFWISYLGLPVAQSMQAGGGFWLLAVDATSYYSNALTAIETGVFTTSYEGFPAPGFVRVLALWLLAVGISPASGLLLNASVYVALCVLIVRIYGPVNDWRRDLPCIIGVGAYSFWPAIFIHATQPLKDDVFFGCIATVCFGMSRIFGLLVYGRRVAGGLGVLVLGGGAALVAMVGMAGIRWYFPMIVCGAALCVFTIFAIRGRSTPLPSYLAGSLTVVVALWLAAGGLGNLASSYMFPSGDQSSGSIVKQITDIPSVLAALTQLARNGFLLTGGNTNIVVPVRKDGQSATADTLATVTPGRLGMPSSGRPALSEAQEDALLAIPGNRSEHLKTIGVGLMVVFVPISVLKALSIVDFPGGRGLLPIADLDTVFQDVVILCLVWLLWTRRHAIGTRLPFVVFCVILAGTTAVLLGYVVTNYGTIFRLRPMIAIPLCVLVVALSSRGEGRVSR
jgi:hypothetical protein